MNQSYHAAPPLWLPTRLFPLCITGAVAVSNPSKFLPHVCIARPSLTSFRSHTADPPHHQIGPSCRFLGKSSWCHMIKPFCVLMFISFTELVQYIFDERLLTFAESSTGGWLLSLSDFWLSLLLSPGEGYNISSSSSEPGELTLSTYHDLVIFSTGIAPEKSTQF